MLPDHARLPMSGRLRSADVVGLCLIQCIAPAYVTWHALNPLWRSESPTSALPAFPGSQLSCKGSYLHEGTQGAGLYAIITLVLVASTAAGDTIPTSWAWGIASNPPQAQLHQTAAAHLDHLQRSSDSVPEAAPNTVIPFPIHSAALSTPQMSQLLSQMYNLNPGNPDESETATIVVDSSDSADLNRSIPTGPSSIPDDLGESSLSNPSSVISSSEVTAMMGPWDNLALYQNGSNSPESPESYGLQSMPGGGLPGSMQYSDSSPARSADPQFCSSRAGYYPDPVTVQCFYICYYFLINQYRCCTNGYCYSGPSAIFPLGACLVCASPGRMPCLFAASPRVILP